jgi:hypothetical protein
VALGPFLVFKMEVEPRREAYHHKCCGKNDQKGSGAENHWTTFFIASNMRPFKAFA